MIIYFVWKNYISKKCSVDYKTQQVFVLKCFYGLKTAKFAFRSPHFSCISKDIIFSNFESTTLKLPNRYCHRTTLPICIDFFDGFRSCRDDGRYQDGLIKTSKIIVIKIRKTRERIARYPLTRLGFLSINAQNFGVDTCKIFNN